MKRLSIMSCVVLCLLLLQTSVFATRNVFNVQSNTNLRGDQPIGTSACEPVKTTISAGSDVADLEGRAQCTINGTTYTMVEVRTKLSCPNCYGHMASNYLYAGKGKALANVNVRTGPGTSYPIMGTMSSGACSKSTHLWSPDDWDWYSGTYPTNNGDKNGYVLGWNYLDIVNSSVCP